MARSAGAAARQPASAELPPLPGWTRRVALGLPLLTTSAVLLWFDFFGLRSALVPSERAHVRTPGAALAAQPAASEEARRSPRACQKNWTGQDQTIERRCLSLQRALEAEAARAAGAAWLGALREGACERGSPAADGSLRRARRPRVGASIAAHPPKYYALASFLEQFAACPAALEALLVVVVFTDEQDLLLFEAGMRCRHPQVPQSVWTPIVAVEPDRGFSELDLGPTFNQKIAAYKKWHGLMYMMGLGADAPDYGLMVDSELLLFANQGDGPDAALDCGADSPWTSLFDRIRAREEARIWTAAVVSDTLATYSFGKYTKSGQDYDRALLDESAHFAGLDKCSSGDGCDEVRRQIKECLFSWWTDLPWVRLRVAEEMLSDLFIETARPSEGGWRTASAGMVFERFEHVSYQQWCVMHKGFRFKDVSNITGQAKWGSFMEDPLPGSRLGELEPIWVSGQASQRAEEGEIAPLSQAVPPLLIFHADQGRSRARREDRRQEWRTTLQAIMEARGIHHPFSNDL